MLLDLDQGSMSIWKNADKLGVMQAEGLRGPLFWSALLHRQGDSARIESADDELAACVAGGTSAGPVGILSPPANLVDLTRAMDEAC